MTTRPRLNRPPTIAAILADLGCRPSTFAPGTVLGAGVYLETGQVRQAPLACVLGPPAVAAGKVLAEWVKLLARRRGGTVPGGEVVDADPACWLR